MERERTGQGAEDVSAPPAPGEDRIGELRDSLFAQSAADHQTGFPLERDPEFPPPEAPPLRAAPAPFSRPRAAGRGRGANLLLALLVSAGVLALFAVAGLGLAYFVSRSVAVDSPGGVAGSPAATADAGAGGSGGVSESGRPSPSSDSSPRGSGTPPAGASPGASASGPGPSGRVHVVSRGENLTAIARRYGVTVAAIVAANKLKNANQIEPGQQLIIPGP